MYSHMGLGARSALACVVACALLSPFADGARAAVDRAPAFDWAMPESYGHALDANGLPEATQPRSVPTYPHKVELTIKDCDPTGDYRISAPGTTLRVLGRDGCTYTLDGFPRFGAYRVRVSIEQQGRVVEREEQVELEQWLIVSLGDSVASGEGVPERVLPGLRARWQNAQCHRSAYAGPAVAARALAEWNPRIQVTFVHLACSGATIEKGLLGPYKGIAGPLFRPRLRPQVDELKDLPQPPTAVLVSVGANDVNFSGLTKLCLLRHILRLGCFAGTGLGKRLAELPGLYGELADALAATKRVAPSRVFLTEYFDPTHGENGAPCGQLETVGRLKILGRRDVEAAYDNLLQPLNSEIAAAVKLRGWREITGVADVFRTHGVCSRETWITSLKASLLNEGDSFLGTLHPSRKGHAAIAALIEPAIARAGRESSCPAQAAGTTVQAAYVTPRLQLPAPAPAAACIAPVALRVAVVAAPSRTNSLGAALWVLIALAILAAATLVLGTLGHPRAIRRNGRPLAGALTGGMLIALGAALIHHAAPAAVLFALGAVALLLALEPDLRRSAGAAGTGRLRSRPRDVRLALVESKSWNTADLVVVVLGAALVVFFAGTTAAIAAGATAPPALWAAGSAVSGALIGLLVPAPGAQVRHEAAAGNAEQRAAVATETAAKHRLAAAAGGAKAAEETANAEAAEKTGREEASVAATHRAAALSSPETKWAAILLAATFFLTLALAVAMAGGAFSPPKELVPSLKGLITAVVAIASASGSALIGILAPSSGKSDAQQAAAAAAHK
jgi:lysophospholipase L1-like esterase